FPVKKAEMTSPDQQATEKDLKPIRETAEDLRNSFVVIWTTTPWTIPGNRAISFSENIEYGLYEVVEAPKDNWAKVGDRYLLATKLAESVSDQARAKFKKVRDVDLDPGAAHLDVTCDHPL